MDGVERTAWKYIVASAVFHLLIGGLVLCVLFKSWPRHQPVSVLQVSLVNSMEVTQSTSERQEPIRIPPRQPVVSRGQPEPPSSFETAASDSRIKDSALEKNETAYDQTVQTQQEEAPPPSSAGPLPEQSQGRDEQAVEDGSRSNELTRFLQNVRNRLEQAKRYPWLARIRGQEGTVRIQFMIDSSGEAREIRLIESSRSKILDQEAVETVKRAGRFSGLPVIWNEKVRIDVPLVFQLSVP
jgi:protein TonB